MSSEEEAGMVEWKLIEEETPPENATVWYSDGEYVRLGSTDLNLGTVFDGIFGRDRVHRDSMTHWAYFTKPSPSPQVSIQLLCPECGRHVWQDQSWWYEDMDPALKERIGCEGCGWRGVVNECPRHVEEL